MHSPGGGPHYDDLPPSYDEAQQQALHDARNGVPPLDPEHHLDVSRLHLDDASPSPQYEIPTGAEVHAHRATAEELAAERSRSVPVQHLRGSEDVPVGRTGSNVSRTASSSIDQSSLRTAALHFTKHQPDTDARYAPRLTRCVAIPQHTTSSPSDRKGKGKARARREERRASRRGRSDAHVPGAWPGTPSTDTLPQESDRLQDPPQFLRAYAKALHAHSIRPAEFLDFLDGLNALCVAAKCTPADLIDPVSECSNPNAELVRNYINATNEAFFAPRGLRVSLRSLASLLDTARIPEERGQFAGAVAGVLDPKATPAKRAQALHPWIEALETNVNEPSISAVMLREMGDKFRNAPPPPRSTNSTTETPRAPESEKSRLEREYAERDRAAAAAAAADDDDPPHSIPEDLPESGRGRHPPFGGSHGRGGRGGRGFGARGGPWTPFGPPGFTPFGPPGYGPHGPPGFGPHGRGGRGGCGPGYGPGHSPWGPRRGPGPDGNGWEALGQSIGKWGEEFGKRMEVWGEQFGKEAAAWGNDFGRQFSGGGSGSGSGSGAAGPSSQRAADSSSSEMPWASNATARDKEQETGVHRGHSNHSHADVASELERPANKKAIHTHEEKDDDDASSISSDSSSDSDSDSDSDDEEDHHEKVSAHFTERIREINAAADAARTKGKKNPSDIERDRAAAIEKAAKDKSAAEEKIEHKRTRRAVMREFKHRRRDLDRQQREARRELRRKGVGKKSGEWREERKCQKEKKRALKREWGDVRRQFREAKKEGRRARRGKGVEGPPEWDASELVWVVVENLD